MTVLKTANAEDFDNAVKYDILKSMMGRKYAPAWLRTKYQRETVGNQQSAILRLTQERYQPYDTPNTYEARIRPLLLGVADNDEQVQGFLKSHLTGDFYTWMRGANPGSINTFFTKLKNMWLECGQNLSGRIPEKLNQFANQVQALPSINPVSYSLSQVTPVFQPAFTKDDIQKAIQDTLTQQKTENQALSYFTPLKPIVPPDSNSEENDGNDYDEDNNMWTGQPETYDELLPKLSPAMRKMCLSQKAQEKQSKKDEWFSFLQYLNASINDLSISESFLDNTSEFDGFNLATAEALGWKIDKPSKFLVKGNSEYISEALGWYTDVAITLRDEKGKPIVTIIGNYACIDNGEPKPMLWLGVTGIRKVKGISYLTNNRFHIENHEKTYTISIFSKAPVVKDPPKEDQDQVSTDSSSPTSEDFKKNA
ncbi:hypothetical protein RclHR1_25460003 [Rhizophagus clarus]|uniref:Uncharacterized protein n=1 Tax=Rhizophagus clarus TaxID=94130 RepID=A0A2Z6R3T5_9GLOM|nr:hypothetical protein RclHR1_25460003 [Rhizophagus clarus]